MVIIYTFMHFMPSIIECFILWRLLTSVMDLKYNKIVPAIASVIMFLLFLLKMVIFNMPGMGQHQIIGTIFMMIYTLLAFYFLTNNTIVEKLVWWGIYILGLIIMELATIFVLSLIFENALDVLANSEPMSLWISVFIKVITLLLFEVLIRNRKGHMVIGVSFFKELTVLIMLNLLLILVVLFTFNNRNDITNKIDNIIFIFTGAVLFITIYTVALIFRIEKKSNEILETKLKLQQIEMELKLNNDMIDITDRLRKLRHDMTNHMGLIKTLVHSKKYEELEEYIDDIYNDVETANELVLTENKTLSILLNAKMNLAKEKKIKFTSIITTQDIQMQNKDICSLLGNILDNAIEAAQTASQKKFIELSIHKSDKGCVIDCENSFGIKPVMKNGRFITSKDQTILHGVGTENIKDIVAKYQGDISFEYDDTVFGVHVIIPIANNN